MLDAILEDARNMAQSTGYKPDDEDLFNIFQLVSMSYAYNADLEPKFRAFAVTASQTVLSQVLEAMLPKVDEAPGLQEGA